MQPRPCARYAHSVGGHDVANSKRWRGFAVLHVAGGEEKFGRQVRGPAWIRIIPEIVTSGSIEGWAFSRRRTASVANRQVMIG